MKWTNQLNKMYTKMVIKMCKKSEQWDEQRTITYATKIQ